MKIKHVELFLFIIMVLLILTVGSAGSVTRTITSTSDNIYSLIKNSNGNYWEANSNNIQIAINDLDNNHGTVWLPGGRTFYLTNTLVIQENVILDMGGSEFRLPAGVNINVVELKDSSTIRNGVIDVSGQQHDGTWPPPGSAWSTNTSFSTPSACIYLDASSYIESASIEYMSLESISDGYNLMGPTPPRFYSSNYLGLGYGIYLHASNTNTPQRISNINVKHVYLRAFEIGIFINNERNPADGENGAFIQYNNFEYLWFYGTSYGIEISRNSNVDKDRCSVGYNRFNMIQFQTGKPSYWGGEELTWGIICTDGRGNSFTNIMMWDYTGNHRGNGPAIYFTSDSENCYLHIYGLADGWLSNSGSNNNLLLVGENEVNLFLGTVYEMGG